MTIGEHNRNADGENHERNLKATLSIFRDESIEEMMQFCMIKYFAKNGDVI